MSLREDVLPKDITDELKKLLDTLPAVKYEPEEVTKLDESAKVNPHSSYGVSKAAVDSMVQVRWKENKTPCIALRQFNCVGERETHPYIVPEIISQLYPQRHQAEAEVYLGNNSTRDFLYAGDAVRMAVELLEKGQFGEVYNLGSESSIKMYDLAEMIGKIFTTKVKVIQDPKRVRPWEIWHLQSNNSKIYSVIDSRPTVNLPYALFKTVEYYASHYRDWETDRKSTRLNSSHRSLSRMPSSA